MRCILVLITLDFDESDRFSRFCGQFLKDDTRRVRDFEAITGNYGDHEVDQEND